MKKTALLLCGALLVLTVGCSRPNKAYEVAEIQGFTNIDIQGPSIFAKGEDDLWATKFEATAPDGSRVKGVVSGGLFKGATLRILKRIK